MIAWRSHSIGESYGNFCPFSGTKHLGFFIPMFRARSRREPSFHMRSGCCSRATFVTVSKSKHPTLPRPLVQRRTNTIDSCQVVSKLVARISLNSTPRNLRLCRSPHLTPTCEISSRFFLPPSLVQRRTISSTPAATMTATKIDGTAIAKKIRDKIHADIENTQKLNPRYKPSLKIIQGIYTCSSRRNTMLTLWLQ